MNDSEFTETLEWGEIGERAFMEIFILYNQNAFIYPLYKGKYPEAPKTYGFDKSYNTPDLLTIDEGKAYYIEVKRKRQWAVPRGEYQRKDIVSGVDDESYKQYMRLALRTKLPVYLVLIQEHSNGVGEDGVFMVDINVHPDREWDGKSKGVQIEEPATMWSIDNPNMFKLEMGDEVIQRIKEIEYEQKEKTNEENTSATTTTEEDFEIFED